jgi:hypothetical protein
MTEEKKPLALQGVNYLIVSPATMHSIVEHWLETRLVGEGYIVTKVAHNTADHSYRIEIEEDKTGG